MTFPSLDILQYESEYMSNRVGEFLKKSRTETDRSLEQIALSSGIDKDYLSKVEDGTCDLERDMLKK